MSTKAPKTKATGIAVGAVVLTVVGAVVLTVSPAAAHFILPSVMPLEALLTYYGVVLVVLLASVYRVVRKQVDVGTELEKIGEDVARILGVSVVVGFVRALVMKIPTQSAGTPKKMKSFFSVLQIFCTAITGIGSLVGDAP